MRSACPDVSRSSTHYVGYVEDDETPEAIMKKFEALERVQTAVAGAAEAGGPDPSAEGEQQLTEAQLLEVFKQTSMFTVRSAMQELVHQGTASRQPAPCFSLRAAQSKAAATTTRGTARRSGARPRSPAGPAGFES